MKTWLITLPILCAATLAMADEIPPEPTEAQPQAAMTQETAKPAKPMRHTRHTHRVTRLPRGDLRHCLDLTDNEDIIRCAETGRKK